VSYWVLVIETTNQQTLVEVLDFGKRETPNVLKPFKIESFVVHGIFRKKFCVVITGACSVLEKVVEYANNFSEVNIYRTNQKEGRVNRK
jgi:hypothetical protein